MTTKITKLEIGAGLASLALVGWMLFHPTPPPTIAHPTPTTTVVTVEKVTEKVVKEFIPDPAQAKLVTDLMAENRRLKLEVTGLTSTIAKLESKGGVGINGGTITQVNPDAGTLRPVSPPSMGVPGVSAPHPVDSYQFKDFQLNANYTSDGKGFDYTLSQSFSIVTTNGKALDGSRLSLVKLYQDVRGNKVEVSSVTTEIQVQANQPKWFVSPRIQGGLQLTPSAKNGLVAAQFIKRGTSLAAEDTTLAILSPGLTFGKDGAKLVLLPISFNLGRIKHNPFTNLWVSPTIDLDKRLGASITATF